MKTSISVSCRFEGIHHWPKAPDEVAFLRELHRHEFHVVAELEVSHGDRELEFITVKRFLQRHVNVLASRPDLGSMSCEMIAVVIYQLLLTEYGKRKTIIRVFEDGENGAIVEFP